MPKFVRLRNLAINIDNVTKINVEKDHMTVEFIGGREVKLHQPGELKRMMEAIERYAAVFEEQ